MIATGHTTTGGANPRSSQPRTTATTGQTATTKSAPPPPALAMAYLNAAALPASGTFTSPTRNTVQRQRWLQEENGGPHCHPWYTGHHHHWQPEPCHTTRTIITPTTYTLRSVLPDTHHTVLEVSKAGRAPGGRRRRLGPSLSLSPLRVPATTAPPAPAGRGRRRRGRSGRRPLPATCGGPAEDLLLRIVLLLLLLLQPAQGGVPGKRQGVRACRVGGERDVVLWHVAGAGDSGATCMWGVERWRGGVGCVQVVCWEGGRDVESYN